MFTLASPSTGTPFATNFQLSVAVLQSFVPSGSVMQVLAESMPGNDGSLRVNPSEVKNSSQVVPERCAWTTV